MLLSQGEAYNKVAFRLPLERLIALMAAPQLRIRELLPTRLIVRQSAWPVAAAEDRQQTLAQLKALVEKL